MRIALHFSNILILKWTIKKNIGIVCGESVREVWGEIEMMHWGVGDRLSASMLAGGFYDEFGMKTMW